MKKVISYNLDEENIKYIEQLADKNERSASWMLNKIISIFKEEKKCIK